MNCSISVTLSFPDFVASRVKESDLGAFLAFAPTMNSEFRCSVRDVEESVADGRNDIDNPRLGNGPVAGAQLNPAAAARDIQPIEAGHRGRGQGECRFLLELDFAQFGLSALGVGKHDFGGRALKLAPAIVCLTSSSPWFA